MSGAEQVRVTLVGAPGCHYCRDAEEALATLGISGAQIQHLDAASADGREFLNRYRAPMLPLVLVDGAFFSFGRLPRNKLLALLADRATDVA